MAFDESGGVEESVLLCTRMGSLMQSTDQGLKNGWWEWGQSQLYTEISKSHHGSTKARFPVFSVLQPWMQTPYPLHMCSWNFSMRVDLTCLVICHLEYSPKGL